MICTDGDWVATHEGGSEYSSAIVVSLSSAGIIAFSSSSLGEGEGLPGSISYGELTDERDGQVYKTVMIGEQEWMAENLNYAAKGSWCTDSCPLYGRHYYYESAVDACPKGFRLPTNEDFLTLVKFVGDDAASLRSTTGWVKKWGKDAVCGVKLQLGVHRFTTPA